MFSSRFRDRVSVRCRNRRSLWIIRTVVSGAAFFSLFFFFSSGPFPCRVRQRSEGLIQGGGGLGETQRSGGERERGGEGGYVVGYVIVLDAVERRRGSEVKRGE